MNINTWYVMNSIEALFLGAGWIFGIYTETAIIAWVCGPLYLLAGVAMGARLRQDGFYGPKERRRNGNGT